MNDTSPATEGVLIPPAKGFALVGGLIGLALAAALAPAVGVATQAHFAVEPHRLAFSYLTALLFVTTIGVGSLAWLMLHHLTGAVWSVALRRLLENLTQPLPWLVLLFIPVAMNLGLLYPWADSSRVSADPELARKTVWLNPVLFDVRMAVYLACWSLIASILARRSARQDRRDYPSFRSGDEVDERLGHGRAGFDHEPGGFRLVDVARPALVLDDLRRLLLGGVAG